MLSYPRSISPGRTRRFRGISLTRMVTGGPLVTAPLKSASRKASAPAATLSEVKSAEEKTAEERTAEEKTTDEKTAEEKPSEAAEKPKKKRRSSKYHFTELMGGQVECMDKVVGYFARIAYLEPHLTTIYRQQTGEKIIFRDRKPKTNPRSSTTIADSRNKPIRIKLVVRKSKSFESGNKSASPPKNDSSDKDIENDKASEDKDQSTDAATEKKDEGSSADRPIVVVVEEKEEEIKMPGQWTASDWAAEQDATILKMKGENKSWREIAVEVGASKKDVSNRFKELQKAAEKEGDGVVEELGGRDGEDGGLGGLWGLFDADSGNADAAAAEKELEPQEEKKGERQNQNLRQSKKFDGSSNNNNDDDDKQEEDGRGGWDGGLKADDIWTRDDCDVLEMLKARYEDQKWQHMQAGFFNWTGRMVLADIIEKKFRDDRLEI